MNTKISVDISSSKEEREDLEILNNFETLPKELLDEALIKAASSGDMKSVETLLKLGADVNTQNHEKQTPLHLAFDRKDYAIVKLLLENGANVDAKDSYGTPLHKACLLGKLEMVKILLKHNANVNERTKTRKTPLHLACRNTESPTIAELLLENGALVDAQDCFSWTPLDHAYDLERLQIAQALLTHGASVRTITLHQACCKGHLEGVKKLIQLNADVNATDEMQRTPLHYACWSGSVEIVQVLLQCNADVLKNIDSKDSDGYTPLHFAIEAGNAEVAKLLLKNGCSTEARGVAFTNDGNALPHCTAFEVALKMKCINILKMVAFHKN